MTFMEWLLGHNYDTSNRLATYNEYQFLQFHEEKLEEVAAATMVGGNTVVLWHFSMVCSCASVAYLVNSILQDQKRIIPCSVMLDGEYGQSISALVLNNHW